MQYQPGQRWISDSEAELGLGTILTSLTAACSPVLYPATGETRQYSLRNAPLTRVRFAPGDEITHFEGWKLTVQEVEDDVDGLLVYHGFDAQNDRPCQHAGNPAVQLHPVPPGQRPPVRRADRPAELVRPALPHPGAPERACCSPACGAWAAARAQPIAHQLHIAREVVADRIAPRVLLADEVGLGKTIEAGLVIHRQLLSGRASRVLILVPENLQHQWLVEMRRRFNLQVALFDAERFAESDADNPFEDTQLALVSLEWLKDEQTRPSRALPSPPAGTCWWSMRRTTWSGTRRSASDEYRLVEQLARRQSPACCCLPPPRSSWAWKATSRACACSTRTVSTTSTPSAPRARNYKPGGRSGAGAARSRASSVREGACQAIQRASLAPRAIALLGAVSERR